MPKMDKKQLEQYLLKFTTDKNNEKDYTEQYAAFYNSVFQLATMLTNFDEVLEEKKKNLKAAEIMQLRSAYEDVLIKANQFKAATAESNLKEMPELAGRIGVIDSFCEYISADMISLSNLSEIEEKTIDDIFDDARSYTIDISGQNINKAGANMSSRIPVSFVNKNGKTLKGFFTPETKVSKKDEINKMFVDAKKDHPEYDLALRIIITDFRFESYTSAIENVTISVATYLQSDNILDVYNDLAKDVLEQNIDQRGDMTEEEYREYIAGLSTDKEFSMRLLNAFREFGQIQNKYRVYDTVGLAEGSIIEQRNAAMSVMGDLIGTPNLLARSVQMTISDNGVKTKGVFMGFAEGSDLMHMKEDDPLKDVTYEQLDNPDLMKQLADLQVLDYICGNTDRHMGNMFYQFKETENGKILSGIVGIDNDNSFGKEEMPKSAGLMQLPGINSLMVINEETAARIKGLSFPIVSVALKNYSLSNDELSMAWDRITLLQQKILEGEQYYRDNPGAKPEPPHLKTVSNEEWNSINLRELSVREGNDAVKEGYYKNYFAKVSTLPKVVADTIENDKRENAIKANIEAKHPELKKDGNGFKMAKGEVFLETNKVGISDNNRRLTSLEADMKDVNTGMFISSKQFNDIISAFHTVKKLSSEMNEGVSNDYLEALNDAYRKLNEKIDIYLTKKESEKKEKEKAGKKLSEVSQSRVEFAEELKTFAVERIDGLDNELARTKIAENFDSDSMAAKFSKYVKNRIARQNDHMLEEISNLPLNDPYSKIKAKYVNARNVLLDCLMDTSVPNWKESKIKENLGDLILMYVAENYRRKEGAGNKLETAIGNADNKKYRSIVNAITSSPYISRALRNVNKQMIKEFLLDNKARHLVAGMSMAEKNTLDKTIDYILEQNLNNKQKTDDENKELYGISNKKKTTFVEGIKGLGVSPLNDDYLAENNHGSFYGGLEVYADVKNELENQPAGEFINFVSNGDGTFHATAKIPEFGMDENGNEYKLREYMNICIKWSYEKLIMPDGTLDDDIMSQVHKIDNPNYDDPVWPDIKNLVPENELESFEAFYHANSNLIQSNIMALYTEANKLLNYDKLIEITPSNSTNSEQEKVNEFLVKTYPDYLNTLKKFEGIKNMDPATEKNIYTSFACDVYGGANIMFAKQVNKYRMKKGIEGSVDLESERIVFHDKVNEPTKINTFEFHVVDLIKANVGGQEFMLSLETTAPPVGQMFYQKSKSPQALGVYRSAEELHNTYKDIRNEVTEYKSVEEKDIAKAISSSSYKKAKLNTIPAQIGSGYIKAEMRVLESMQPKASYGQLLDTIDKIDKYVWSSTEFANMKKALKALNHVDSMEDYIQKMAKLREDASKYIIYKDPNGNAAKAKKMNQLAKSRLALAKEILTFASFNERKSIKALAETELAARVDNVIKNQNNKDVENAFEKSDDAI